MASSASASASSSSSLGKRPAPAADQNILEATLDGIRQVHKQKITALEGAFEQDKQRLIGQYEKKRAAKSQEYEPSLGSLDTLLAATLCPAVRAKLQQAHQLVQEARDQDLSVLEDAYDRKVQQKEEEFERVKTEKEEACKKALEALGAIDSDTTTTATPPRRPRLDDGQQAATNVPQPQQHPQQGEEADGMEESEEEEEEDDGESSSEEEDSEDETEDERVPKEDEEGEERQRRRRRRQPARHGHALVHKRIQVYSAENETFYNGVVTGFSDATGKHAVRYDHDGTIVNLDLLRETIAWPDEEEEEEEEDQPVPPVLPVAPVAPVRPVPPVAPVLPVPPVVPVAPVPPVPPVLPVPSALSLAEAFGQGTNLPDQGTNLPALVLPFLNDRECFNLARVTKALQAAVSNPAAWTGNRRLDVMCSSGYTCMDAVSQGGRRRPSYSIAAQGLCRYLTLPQFAGVDALYLKVMVFDVPTLTATVLEKFPQLKTLLLDGRGVYSHLSCRWDWSIPAIFDLIRRLTTLRELQFPLGTSKGKDLFPHIPHVHTLHLMRPTGHDGAGLNTLLNIPPLPNIRVLTLIAFEKMNYSAVKSILLAFPQLKMLSLRYTYLHDDIVDLRERIMADAAFGGRAEGWFDRIVFDLDNQELLRALFTTGIIQAGQPRWLRQNLSAYDDTTGEVKQSVGDLRNTYAYLRRGDSFPYDLV